MLTSLTIKNYALIDELSVDLKDGLVIITGETGAGKSIIVGALGLVLGGRASSDVVLAGASRAIIEAQFKAGGNEAVDKLLAVHQLDRGDDLILRREVAPVGQTRCFVNDTPVQLSVLRQIGDLLIDIHGQHEHQSLLKTGTHIRYLDEFANLNHSLGAYNKAFDRLRSLVKERSELDKKESDLKEKLDLYRFQQSEIDAVRPDPAEEEELYREVRVLENAEKLFMAAREIGEILYEGEQSVFDRLSGVSDTFRSLSSIDGAFAEAVGEAESAKAIVQELSRCVGEYTAGIDFSPERLEAARERLGQLSLLKKKYGGTLESVVAHRENIAGALATAENLETERSRISGEIEELRQTCWSLAEKLSAKRAIAARKLEKEIVRVLGTLGISNGRFSVRIVPREIVSEGRESEENLTAIVDKGKTFALDKNGRDQVEFLVSMNLGAEMKPLAKVASGGEISRIMLALKSTLARRDHLPVVVFDELDVGVSGRVAQAVGECLKRLSESLQAIVITHLPQIAALGDSHLSVSKVEEGGKTRIRLRNLDVEERVEEVARLLSGAEITDAALTGARELIRTT